MDMIHEQFMYDVSRAAARLDQRACTVQFYRGANNEPHSLSTIVQMIGTPQQYVAAIIRELPFLHQPEYDGSTTSCRCCPMRATDF